MNNLHFSGMGVRVPQWKISVTVSILIHLLIVTAIFFVPAAKKAPEKQLVARLITPSEWLKEFPARRPLEMPSNAPPKHLYGEGRTSSRLRETVSKETKQLRESAKTPIPLPAQPLSRTPEKTVSSDRTDKGLAERGSSAPEKSASGPSQGDSAAINPPKISGIPAPMPSLREKLFDREVVGKIAKREEKTRDSSITFDAGEFRYEGYMSKLRQKIEAIWKYPQDAARSGIQGDLKIRFTIRKNGKLDDVEVIRTSGYRMLDEAAVQALKDGNPFWPLPEDWGKDSLTITGHFVYSIYGSYVR